MDCVCASGDVNPNPLGVTYVPMAAAAPRGGTTKKRERAASPAPPPPAHTVLGKGSYGCVLTPAYACSDFSDKERDEVRAAMRPGLVHVSKFMNDDKLMVREWGNLIKVREVDPAGEFTVPMAGMCPAVVPLQDVQDAPDAQKCGPAMSASLQTQLRTSTTNKPTGQLRQLILEYGGVDWWNVLSRGPYTAVPLAVLLQSLTPVVMGLPKLAAAGVFHKDVKPPNIVFDGSTSRLVDFGLAATSKTELFNRNTISGTYEFWPPECDLIAASVPGLVKSDGLNSTKTTSKYLRFIYPKQEDLQQQINTMKAQLALDAPTDKSGLVEFCTNHFGAKFDVFGLGLSVLHLAIHAGKTKRVGYDSNKLLQWVAHTANYNAFARWDAARAAEEWANIWAPPEPPRRSRRVALAKPK